MPLLINRERFMEEGRAETWQCPFTRPLCPDVMSRVIVDPALSWSPAREGLWEDCRLEAPPCPQRRQHALRGSAPSCSPSPRPASTDVGCPSPLSLWGQKLL